jgi:hypothetical protein
MPVVLITSIPIYSLNHEHAQAADQSKIIETISKPLDITPAWFQIPLVAFQQCCEGVAITESLRQNLNINFGVRVE